MRFIFILIPFLIVTQTICQTPKTEDLIISSDKFNVLYAHVDNPISLNQSFDSLRFEDGEVHIINSKIYLLPNATGRKHLYLYTKGEVRKRIFRVKELEKKPQIVFKRKSHSKGGRLKDKKEILVIWDVDYDIKLEIKHFKLEIEKQNGELITLLNISNRFNYSVLNAFGNLKSGDKIRLFEIQCALPSGRTIEAQEFRTIAN